MGKSHVKAGFGAKIHGSKMAGISSVNDYSIQQDYGIVI